MNLFKTKKSSIGIDIGYKCTKIVKLNFRGSSTPDLADAFIIDSGFGDENLVTNLKTFLNDVGLSGAMVAASFDDPTIRIRKVELPKMPEADLLEAIKWDIRDRLDGDIDEFTVNHSLLDEKEDGDNIIWQLVAYAVKKETIYKVQRKLESVGLMPFMIEPAAVTLSAALDRCYPKEDDYIAGVEIGYTRSLFFVIGKRNFIYSRIITDISLEQLEKEPENFLQKVAIQVQKSVDTFQVIFKTQGVSQLLLCGGGALIPDIVDYLSTNLGIPVSKLNPFSTLNQVENFPDLKPELFTQAVSLAYVQPK